MFQSKLSLCIFLFAFCRTTEGLYRSVGAIKSLKLFRPSMQNVGISKIAHRPIMQTFLTAGEQHISANINPPRFRRIDSPDFAQENLINKMATLHGIDFTKQFANEKLIKMDFTELFNAIKANDELSASAAEILRQRIGHMRIVINNEYLFPNDDRKMFIDGNKFVIRNTSMALEYLQNFGDGIWSLELEFRSGDKKDVKKVMKYVNRYCSESLVELSVTVSDGKLPLDIKHPFENLGKLSLINRSINEQTVLPTNQSFPSLNALHLDVKKLDQINSNHLFPQLNELYAYIHNEYNENMLINLIEMNPHIRTLNGANISSALLRTLSAKLPHLDSLNIASIEMDDQKVRIENLREFSTPRYSCNLTNFDFPNLQIFNVFYETMSPSSVKKFLEKHQNLTQIHISHRTMFDADFEHITSMLPDLVEVSVTDTTHSSMNTNSIVRFIESHSKLVKFHVNECNQDDKSFFHKQIGRDWLIQDYENGLSFERTEKSMFNKLLSTIGFR